MRTMSPELEAKIDEIKTWMFYGDAKEVAKRSQEWGTRVSEVLNKKRVPNKRILDAAIEIMNENKARFECGKTMKVA